MKLVENILRFERHLIGFPSSYREIFELLERNKIIEKENKKLCG